jgi:hypothetical protein
MPKKKKLDPKVIAPPISQVPRAAYTIPEFCEAHRISESMYYKGRDAGVGPREGRMLTKVIISFESAADWRREIEKRSQLPLPVKGE